METHRRNGELGWVAATIVLAIAGLQLEALRANDAGLRSPKLCGVAFVADEVRITAGRDAPGLATVEHVAAPNSGAPLVMRFDEPADFVDFLAQAPVDARLAAELVAYDADGRIVDVDSGPAIFGEAVTMQVTADGPVIREAHFRFIGLDQPTVVTLSHLDVGARPEFCPLDPPGQRAGLAREPEARARRAS